jgi:hypothetical protein
MPFAIENDKNKNKFKTGSTLLSGSAYKEITAEWSSRIGLTELSHASSDASLARKKKTGFGQGLTTLPAVWCWS